MNVNVWVEVEFEAKVEMEAYTPLEVEVEVEEAEVEAGRKSQRVVGRLECVTLTPHWHCSSSSPGQHEGQRCGRRGTDLPNTHTHLDTHLIGAPSRV